jgi:hypothetical protein
LTSLQTTKEKEKKKIIKNLMTRLESGVSKVKERNCIRNLLIRFASFKWGEGWGGRTFAGASR